LGLLLVIGTAILYGPQAAIDVLGDLAGFEETTPVQQPVEEYSESGAFYTVYFTDPVIPFNDVTTGGVDSNIIPLINQATQRIDVALFEFDLQNVADALIDAHTRGVDVRLVYDDEHTEDDPQVDQLIDAGIPAVADERSAFMHNKFLVIDGQTVVTGSMNFTENGVYRNNNNLIVIRSARLAENYTTEFEEMFIEEEFGPRSPSNTPNPVITLDGVRIENYFAPEDEVITRLVELVEGAEESVNFMAFAFTQDDLGSAMRAAVRDGVDVAGVFETRGAATEFSECGSLLETGARVRLDENPRTFHHKVIIIDSSIVVIGSFNFSQNATESNDENLVIVYDSGLASVYEAEFERQFNQSVAPDFQTVCRRDN
jgi:phosphatidylserine/phosphatidylglycerophosphate/cardiolipin synthase-like enzyme